MSPKLFASAICGAITATALCAGHYVGAELGAGVGWGIFVAVVLALFLLCGVIWFVFFRGDGTRMTG